MLKAHVTCAKELIMLDVAMSCRILQNKEVPKSYQHAKHFSTMALEIRSTSWLQCKNCASFQGKKAARKKERTAGESAYTMLN